MAPLAQPYLAPVDAARSCPFIVAQTPDLLRLYSITRVKTICIRKWAIFFCERR